MCCVTAGPGATNLVSGIAEAFIGALPIVILAGRVGPKFPAAFVVIEVGRATVEERLMGILLVMLSVQMVLNGLSAYMNAA